MQPCSAMYSHRSFPRERGGGYRVNCVALVSVTESVCRVRNMGATGVATVGPRSMGGTWEGSELAWYPATLQLVAASDVPGGPRWKGCVRGRRWTLGSKPRPCCEKLKTSKGEKMTCVGTLAKGMLGSTGCLETDSWRSRVRGH